MFNKQEQNPSLSRIFYPVSSRPVREYRYMMHDITKTVKRVYEHRPPQGQPAAADIVRNYAQTRKFATDYEDIDFDSIDRNFGHEANNNSDHDGPAIEIFAEYTLVSEKTVTYTKIMAMKAITFELEDAEGYIMEKTVQFENPDEFNYVQRDVIEVENFQESN